MNIIVPNAIPTLTIGGRVFTDLQNLIILYCFCGPQGSTLNGTFRKAGASSGYTPSGSKTFKLSAIKYSIQATAAAATGSVLIGYADADVGLASAAGLTNGVFIAGGGSPSNIGVGMAVMKETYEAVCDFVVPNTKYLCAQAAAASAIATVAFGYEV